MKPINFLNTTLLETTDPHFAEIYKNLQGNILKGHGRDHATMIFIKFKSKNTIATKKAIADYSENYVTNFYTQLWERERYKRNKIPGGIFGAIFITRKGYNHLGEKKHPADEAFTVGMKDRTGLNDLDIEIEDGYKSDIDAMLLLADDDKKRMDLQVRDIIRQYEKIFKIVHIEYGDAIRNANGDGLEHNGYVDGISQPLFLKDEVEEYIRHHNVKNDKFEFDPRAAPGLVLVEDPLTEKNSNCYGSYFVFRKLEQDVRGFKEDEAAIGESLYGKEGDLKERSGAMLVGRFEDGTPVTLQGEDKLIGSGAYNDFNYSKDSSGGKCPHFAHIRKTNPRTDNKFDEHTMARRGIPFGHRNVTPDLNDIKFQQFPSGGVGLLFMSYQKSIVNQFEFIQLAANANEDGGVDPVIGQNATRDKYSFPQDTDLLRGPKTERNHSFTQHIKFKGGEYFFAPSIPYLKSLLKQ